MIRFERSQSKMMDEAGDFTCPGITYFRLIVGRLSFVIEVTSTHAIQRTRSADEYFALKQAAREAWDPDDVQMAVDDLYAAGGNSTTAAALLRRIIDGYRPWPTSL